MFILIHQPMLRSALYILLRITLQHQLCIFKRLIVDQPVQLRPLIHIVGELILRGNGKVVFTFKDGKEVTIKE